MNNTVWLGQALTERDFHSHYMPGGPLWLALALWGALIAGVAVGISLPEPKRRRDYPRVQKPQYVPLPLSVRLRALLARVSAYVRTHGALTRFHFGHVGRPPAGGVRWSAAGSATSAQPTRGHTVASPYPHSEATQPTAGEE